MNHSKDPFLIQPGFHRFRKGPIFFCVAQWMFSHGSRLVVEVVELSSYCYEKAFVVGSGLVNLPPPNVPKALLRAY